ncbi:ribonuclease R family protein [Lysinibacillus sp. UGB7]|uniref:ribonuclease R family protein n=1 Tax=Lysinibacillus sp. UGB7 TaxID=3411039 RepID=UPI003B76DC03
MLEKEIVKGLSIFRKERKPFTVSSLSKTISIDDESKGELIKFVSSLKKAGFLHEGNKKRLHINQNKKWIFGEFLRHKDGYGFVNAEEVTVFVPSQSMKDAMHKDFVLIEVVSEGTPNAIGCVASVLSRPQEIMTGVFQLIEAEGSGFVICDNPAVDDVYIPVDKVKGAAMYDRVRFRVTKGPKQARKAEGEIIDILNEIQMDEDLFEKITEDRGIPVNFTTKTMKEVEGMKFPYALDNRLDLQDQLIFTIDGADSKDLDDAVSIKRIGKDMIELGVHIADVSHYVKEGGSIDKEAYNRGISVYFPDKVVPMLPTKLSNDLCSLIPNEGKLALSVFMQIDCIGDVKSYRFAETVIHSKCRFTYERVTEFLEGRAADPFDIYTPVASDKTLLIEALFLLKDLSILMRNKRFDRGALDFHRAEAKIVVGDDGKLNIKNRESNIGHKMIEEAMLLCNETVAKHFSKTKLPFLYRVHNPPGVEKMDLFKEYVIRNGYECSISSDVQPKELQTFIAAFKEKPVHKSFEFFLLRCMNQAQYKSVCEGHFGLAATDYCHFTSPIRRYPDLMIHRVLKAQLCSQLHSGLVHEWENKIEEMAKHCSKRERVADKAEEDYFNVQKLEWANEHRGELMTAYIREINKYSIEVVLDNNVLVMVRNDVNATEVNDDLTELQMDNVTLKLGDEVVVEIVHTDVVTKDIIARIVGIV